MYLSDLFGLLFIQYNIYFSSLLSTCGYLKSQLTNGPSTLSSNAIRFHCLSTANDFSYLS